MSAAASISDRVVMNFTLPITIRPDNSTFQRERLMRKILEIRCNERINKKCQ